MAVMDERAPSLSFLPCYPLFCAAQRWSCGAIGSAIFGAFPSTITVRQPGYRHSGARHQDLTAHRRDQLQAASAGPYFPACDASRDWNGHRKSALVWEPRSGA